MFPATFSSMALFCAAYTPKVSKIIASICDYKMPAYFDNDDVTSSKSLTT